MWGNAWRCLVQWQISIPVVDLLSLSSGKGAFGICFSSVLEHQQEVRKGGRLRLLFARFLATVIRNL